MIAEPEPIAIDIEDIDGGYRARLHRAASSKKSLILQLTIELSFEMRILLKYRWLADDHVAVVIAPAPSNPPQQLENDYAPDSCLI